MPEYLSDLWRRYRFPIVAGSILAAAVIATYITRDSRDAGRMAGKSAATEAYKKPKNVYNIPKLTPKPVRITEGKQIDLEDPQQFSALNPLLPKEGLPDFLKIIYATHIDMNNDGRDEISVIIDNSRDNRKFFGVYDAITGKGIMYTLGRRDNAHVKYVKFLDLNKDGSLEAIVGLSEGSEEWHSILEWFGPESVMKKGFVYWTLDNEPRIMDLDGDGFPEIYDTKNGRVLEARWDHSWLTTENDAQSTFTSAVDDVISYGARGDLPRLREIEEMYQPDVAALLREAVLNSPEFNALRYQLADPKTLAGIFATQVIRNAGVEYQKRRAVEKDAELVRSIGGNPDIHTLVRDANGNVSLREKRGGAQQPPVDQYTVRKTTGSDQHGTYEQRRVALTPDAANQIKDQNQQQKISNDPVMKGYKALENAGQKILSPFAPKKK